MTTTTSTSAALGPIVGLAIIGKNNKPLYLKEFGNDDEPKECSSSTNDLFGLSSSSSHTDTAPSSSSSTSGCSLRLQFMFHSALDQLEQASGPPPGCQWRQNNNSKLQQQTNHSAMFIGRLEEQEEYAIYGT